MLGLPIHPGIPKSQGSRPLGIGKHAWWTNIDGNDLGYGSVEGIRFLIKISCCCNEAWAPWWPLLGPPCWHTLILVVWWPLTELLFWCSIFKSSHCSSFEGWVRVDIALRPSIFKWVAMTWLKCSEPIVVLIMATRVTCPILIVQIRQWQELLIFAIGILVMIGYLYRTGPKLLMNMYIIA